ncbi:retrovirus-related pol polyprotein from transposon TNT 1-94 [Tanacetum coccineum]
MAFGGNTRHLSSFGEETDEITDLHQIFKEILLTERGDDVAGIKRHRRDLSSDDVRNLATTSKRGRTKETLEDFVSRDWEDHFTCERRRNLFDEGPSFFPNQKPKSIPPAKNLREHSSPNASGFLNPIILPEEPTNKVLDAQDILLFIKIQTASIDASAAAMYSVFFVEDIAVVLCLTLFQSTAPPLIIMELLVKKKQKSSILELKRRHLKNTIFCTYTPYPAIKIRRISASSAQETRNDQFPIRQVAFRKSTCFVRDLKGNDLLTSNCGSNLYTIALEESSLPTLICFMAKASPTQAWLWHRRLSHLNFDTINLLSKNYIVNGLLKFKYVNDQLCLSCEIVRDGENLDKMKAEGNSRIFVGSGLRTNDHSNEPSSSKLVPNDVPTANKTATSLQKLELLFSPMYEEYFNAENQSVLNFSALSDNLQLQDTLPTLNVQPILELIIPPTNDNDEENNNNQADDAQFKAYEFINPFAPPGTEAANYSSCNVDTTNMHTIYQRYRFDYHWTKDHPLEQVHGNPSKPVQTR